MIMNNKIYNLIDPVTNQKIPTSLLTLGDIKSIVSITNEYINEKSNNMVVNDNFDVSLNMIFNNKLDCDITKINTLQRNYLFISLFCLSKSNDLKLNYTHVIEDSKHSDNVSINVKEAIEEYYNKYQQINRYVSNEEYEIEIDYPLVTKEYSKLDNWIKNIKYLGEIVDITDFKLENIPLNLFLNIKKVINSLSSMPMIDVMAYGKCILTGEDISKKIVIPDLYFFFIMYLYEFTLLMTY